MADTCVSDPGADLCNSATQDVLTSNDVDSGILKWDDSVGSPAIDNDAYSFNSSVLSLDRRGYGKMTPSSASESGKDHGAPATNFVSTDKKADLSFMKSDKDVSSSSIDNSVLTRLLFKAAASTLLLIIGTEIARAVDPRPPSPAECRRDFAAGWLGAAGAMLGYGCSGATMKFNGMDLPEHERSLLFNALSPLGNAAFTALLCSSMRLVGEGAVDIEVPIEARIFAYLGAINMVVVQVVAFFAMQRLGLATGPTIWTSIGILTSFLWGIAYFNEEVTSYVVAFLGIVLVVIGLASATLAGSDLPGRLLASYTRRARDKHIAVIGEPSSSEKGDVDNVEECKMIESVPFKIHDGTTLVDVRGVLLAVTVGLLDGAMLVPLKCFRKAMVSVHGTYDIAYVFVFLETERLVLLCIGMLIIVGHCIQFLIRHGLRNGLMEGFRNWFKVISMVVLPGFLHGILWAAGNIGAVHATEYLGIALGFPLSQLALFVALTLGLCYFGELSTLPQRLFVIAGAAVAFVGSTALAASSTSVGA